MITLEPGIVNSRFRSPVVEPGDGEPVQDRDDPLYWRLRRANDAFLRRQHWWRYEPGALKNNRQREAQRLSRRAEHWIATCVRELGYLVNLTPHKTAFDLWVENDEGRVAKVEVKASRYHPCRRGGRFQANIRHHHTADIVIFVVYDDDELECRPFVIPMADIAPRGNIAIWSSCPADYTGQWAPYLDAWDHLHRAVANAARQPSQPSLF